jgi:hypothetical protein
MIQNIFRMLNDPNAEKDVSEYSTAGRQTG